MNLNKVKELSDEQLVGLYRNPSTAKELKTVLLHEISKRDFAALQSESDESPIEFTQNEKLRLIGLPFLFRYHRKSMFKEQWSANRDKQFWNYITIGIAMYILLLLVFLLFSNQSLSLL